MRNDKPMIHDLKCWPSFFQSTLDGDKTFEVRNNDRNFLVGDTVRLKEYDPEKQYYTGREKTFTISYVLANFVGNAQLLKKIDATVAALKDNTKIIIPEGQSLINVLGDLSSK